MTTDTRQDFIDALSNVPGAVAVVAACHDGARGGLTATAWASVTADPPTLLACVNRNASAHPLIIGGGIFSINALAAADVETASIFSAQRGLEGEARFDAAAWCMGPSGAPLFLSAVAAFECALIGQVDYGTHTVLVGEVLTVRYRGGADALLYVRRSFASASAITEPALQAPCTKRP